MKSSRRTRWIPPVSPVASRCIETEDNAKARVPVASLFNVTARDPAAGEARLATQLLEQNAATLRAFDVLGRVHYAGQRVEIELETNAQVGAFPLVSPTTGRPDFGLVVRPRFGWRGLGATLYQTGWKVLPEILNLQMVPTSERRVPPWVLSSVILVRLEQLLRTVRRTFLMSKQDLTAPQGSVDWTTYATARIPNARMLSVPCLFPDLGRDARMLAGIHWTLRRQLASLESQREGGGIVAALITLTQSLIGQVRHVLPARPVDADFRLWQLGQMPGPGWHEGIEAMQWTVDERGLAGLSDWSGLPWRLSMEAFFEGWVETVAGSLARRLGGTLATGRKSETLAPFRWDPPFAGSQRYLLPDVVLRSGDDEVVIFDAKYKEHWQEIGERAWSMQPEELRERHREDLLQVLAYSTLFSERTITCCLAYPCRPETWDRMKERGMLVHRAEVGLGGRSIRLVLCAMPFGLAPESIATELAPAFAA